MYTNMGNWCQRLAWCCAAVAVLACGTSANAQQLRDRIKVLVADEDADADAATEPLVLGEYWIGLGCSPAVDEALRAHLQLPEGQGLQVQTVLDDSPAAKAGIARHDVLLSAGDEPLKDVGDLVRAVDAAKESPISLRLLRAGKEQTIEVTPAKRPKDQQLPLGEESGDRNVRQWFEQWRDGRGPRVMQLMRPGMMFDQGKLLDAPLPEGMSITISKTGDKPASISVKRGDESWEVTQDKLDELPEDVRGHVGRLLGRMPLAMRLGPDEGEVEVEVLPPEPQAGERITRRRIAVGGERERPDRLERRIDELGAQIKELSEAVQRLQKDAEKP